MVAKSQIKGHMGELLLVVAGTYPNLLDFILEVVQNAIDAKPKEVIVRVNLKKRTVTVTDDGCGVSQSKFEKALQQIGLSMKKDDSLGRFGRGLVSPLGKCESFTFTSCPASNGKTHGFLEWKFVTEDIKKKADGIGIPMTQRQDMVFCRKDKKPSGKKSPVPWRTQVHIKGVIKDTYITKLGMNTLVESILDKYGAVMRKKKILVRVIYADASGKTDEREVKARDFEGRKIPQEVFNHPDCGDTFFNLYLSRMTAKGRKGKVLFGEKGDDFRLTIRQFAMAVRMLDLVDDEVIKALLSGVFEGEILSEKIRLHPSRKSFVKNDALVGFLVCLEEWYKKVAFKYIEEVNTKRRETRYQELGLRSIKVVQEMLKLPEWKDILEQFKVGNIGIGHTDLPSIGKQKEKSLSTQGNPGQFRESSDEESGDRAQASEQEREKHSPMSVQGPQGNRRTLVRSGSKGIQFMFEEMASSTHYYEFNPKYGILSFNTRHRFWFECENKDSSLMRYIETVAVVALTLLRFKDTEFYHHQKLVMDEALKLFVFNIKNGDVLSGRQAGKLKSISLE